MGSRDRPSKEVKKKAQPKDAKSKLQPLLEPPTNVEVVKPKRKPRREDAPDEG
jgi:hypothetical protein